MLYFVTDVRTQSQEPAALVDAFEEAQVICASS
jgi:hypothetical protein